MEDITSLTDDRKTYILDHFPTEQTVGKLAEFFAVFADNTRLKILMLLSIQSMLVGDIAEILQIHQTTASHQLKSLRQLGIVDYVRSGKCICYSLVNADFLPIMDLVVELPIMAG